MSSESCAFRVSELLHDGILWVEDGNHGENRPRADEFCSDGTPFVRPDDLINGTVEFRGCDRINDTALRRVRKGKGRSGDIVFTHRATVGRIARVGPKAPSFVANPGVTVWRVLNHEVLDLNYLYYFMQTRFFMDQVWAEAGNTDTFPYISLTQQRRLQIRFPGITEQREMGAVLGALDDRIALLRETNATLEAIAQALFKSWFVDFDPVRAKQQGLAPAGIDEATAALFPATAEDWQRQASRPTVSELIATGALLIGDGYRAKNDELGQPGLPFVRAGDLDEGQITPTKDFLAEPAVKAAAPKMAKPGDTAFTSKGTIGRFAFVDDASGEAVYSLFQFRYEPGAA